MKALLHEKYGVLIVLALMAAYSVFFSALSIQRHNTFRTYASDLGQMDQALWNTLHGHLLEDTRQDPNGNTARQAPRLTDHVEPIFLPISLVYLVYDGVEAILVLQSMAIALGALPLFWIARRRLKRDWAAVVFAAVYLLFPALQAANLAEFHAVTFAPAPLLLAYNYAEQGAWRRFALFALIALAVKEDMALLVFAMAAWAALRQQTTDDGQRIAGLPARSTVRVFRWTVRVEPIPAAIALVSLLWFAVALLVIVPNFSPRGESVYIGRYPEMSRDPLRLLAAVPRFIGGMFVPEKIAYVLKLLASVGFVALLDPLALLLGSPPLVLNLLSTYEAQYSGTYHYSAPVAPYFVLAAIGGAGVLSGFLRRRFGLRHSLALVTVPVFLVVLGYQAIAGYTPIGGAFVWPESTPHQQLLARFTSEVPPDVPVSTTKTLFPHLSHRRFLYRFPTIENAEYILLDVSQSISANPVDFAVNYRDALAQGFGIRDAVDGYILLQRGAPQKELPDGFYTFLRACECTRPQQSVPVNFGDKIEFLGYDVKYDDWGRVYLRTYWRLLPGFDNLNYALYPFFMDADGTPRADAEIPPLMVHFWYPTANWQPGEVVVGETVPMDIGDSANIGLGVFFGATWDTAERRLEPYTTAPVRAGLVTIGELVRKGDRYQAVILP